MNRLMLFLVLLSPPTVVGAARAADSGSFVVTLGSDTTSVERYERTATRVDVQQVGRAPRVLRRHFTYEFEKGAFTGLRMVVTPPGSETPTQTIDATVGPDSLRMKVQSGKAPVQNVNVAWAPGTVVIASSSPWTGYEGQIMKLVQSKKDSLRSPLYFLGAGSLNSLLVSKLGRDSVMITNDHADEYHVRIDKTGRILGVLPVAGTAKFAATRVANLDLDAMAAAFAAREQSGVGLGTLSPRDTVRAENIAGASLWVDYGRPGKRGRTIFGSVVPYGEVWRTGANAATQFRTDKALVFGTTVVPAGFYTLWTLPTANGWKLILNSETGQWGTDHKADKDLFTLDMMVSALPQPVERFTISVDTTAGGGVLNLDWDTTRASIPFTVRAE